MDAQFTYIDIGILALLFIFMIVGYKKGFIETILGLVGGLVSLVVAVLLANQVSALLYPLFGMGPALEGQMETFLINILGAQDPSSPYRLALGNREQIAIQVHDAIVKLGLPVQFTESISNTLSTAIAGAFAGTQFVDKSLIQILSPVLANAVMILISVIATFIVIRIIIAIIEAIAKAILRTSKSLRGINGLLGALAGVLKGALLVIIIFTVGFFVLGGVEPGSEVTDIKSEVRTAIDNSTIAKYVYENNPVPKLITDNINFDKIIDSLLGIFSGEQTETPTESPSEDSA